MTAVNAAEAQHLTAKLQQAMALHRQGRLTHAQAIYEKILKLQPRHFDALHLLGVVAAQTNNPVRALTLIGKAIAINPHHADAFCNQGTAFKALGQFDAALRSYDQAIAIRPDYAEAHCCRGTVLGELRRWNEALRSCERAIELKPPYADAYCSRGAILKALGQLDAALASYDRAIALNPNFVEAHNERGIVLRESGDRGAALASYERALAANPDYVQAHLNRGNVFMDLYRLDEALSSFGRAIALKSDFAEARANRASILLLRGEFAQGWADYEWRWSVKSRSIARQKGNFSQVLWLGRKPIAGKTVLLVAAQGLGDTLQFCRYATLVARLRATVMLQVPRPLVAVLSTLEGVAAVYGDEEPLPAFDTYCRITSLPLAFQTTLSTIPAQVPYLRSSAAKALRWRQRLGEKVKARVGLTWSGLFRPNEQEGWSVLNHRIIPLTKLASLKRPDIEFYSLQKGQPAESELEHLRAAHWDGPELIGCADELHDFSDTAALIEQLDLVISVDTSIAHLAGAMGKPVWILLCFDSCWRWLTQRSDSPWYPTARLYRQERPGDWDSVVERVRQDLDVWLNRSVS
jgi:tetratricopeptide (TPR) repeat protein